MVPVKVYLPVFLLLNAEAKFYLVKNKDASYLIETDTKIKKSPSREVDTSKASKHADIWKQAEEEVATAVQNGRFKMKHKLKNRSNTDKPTKKYKNAKGTLLKKYQNVPITHKLTKHLENTRKENVQNPSDNQQKDNERFTHKLIKKRQNAWMGNLNTSTKKQQNSKEKQKATKRHQNMVLNNCTQENVKNAAKIDEFFSYEEEVGSDYMDENIKFQAELGVSNDKEDENLSNEEPQVEVKESGTPELKKYGVDYDNVRSLPVASLLLQVEQEVDEIDAMFDQFNIDTKFLHETQAGQNRKRKEDVLVKLQQKIFAESSGDDYSLHFIQGRIINDHDIVCDSTVRYRSADGSCNNLEKPFFGQIGQGYWRLLPSSFEKGPTPNIKNTPRGGFFNSTLPNARKLSLALYHEIPTHTRPKMQPAANQSSHSALFPYLGQMMAHDVAFTNFGHQDCCKSELLSMQKEHLSENSYRCFPIPSDNDPFFNLTCLSLVRSGPVWTPTTSDNDMQDIIYERDPINQATSFIDASHVYGTEESDRKEIRANIDGLMKENSEVPSFPIPSINGNLKIGDIRGFITPMLQMYHALLIKEHNLMADSLKSHLSPLLLTLPTDQHDEVIFQEAKKLTLATYQHLIYDHFARILLGDQMWNKHGLSTEIDTEYDATINPTTTNEFNIAFRSLHTTIPAVYKQAAGLNTHYALRDEYFSSDFVIGDGGQAWQHGLIGGISTPCQKGSKAVDDITDFLQLSNNNEDLIAIDIQRGRDHGTPTYHNVRVFCGLEALTNDWSNRPQEIQEPVWQILKGLYSLPLEIDLLVGGHSEDISDGFAAPTFSCIIEKQFTASKMGDRFFFTHSDRNNSKGLPARSKELIRKRSLSDMFCAHLNVSSITKDVFRLPGANNPEIMCSDSNELDFKVLASDILKGYGINAETITECAGQVDDVNSSPANLNDIVVDNTSPSIIAVTKTTSVPFVERKWTQTSINSTTSSEPIDAPSISNDVHSPPLISSDVGEIADNSSPSSINAGATYSSQGNFTERKAEAELNDGPAVGTDIAEQSTVDEPEEQMHQESQESTEWSLDMRAFLGK